MLTLAVCPELSVEAADRGRKPQSGPPSDWFGPMNMNARVAVRVKSFGVPYMLVSEKTQCSAIRWQELAKEGSSCRAIVK